MPQLNAINAGMRVNNYENKRVCTVFGVSPTVEAETAANFVDAIEKLYNSTPCSARVSITLELVREGA